jgi:hypothetical protein
MHSATPGALAVDGDERKLAVKWRREEATP